MSVAFEALGFAWDTAAVPRLRGDFSPREVMRAFVKNMPDFVWNTTALEGNTFTFPEVQTLMDGVTVGGHVIHEQHQVEDTAAAYAWLAATARGDRFVLDKATSDQCNLLLAGREALEAGKFRTGPVSVRLGERGAYHPPDAAELDQRWRDGLAALGDIEWADERALAYFAFGARNQFYFDGNERTSRHMLNGLLLTSGFHAIAVPYARRLEFNEACVTMYADADATPIMRFLASCSIS